jgi:phytoene desaturase
VPNVKGATFDSGPTVITALFLLDILFELFGKTGSGYIKLIPVEPWFSLVFADERQFDYGGTSHESLYEIAKRGPDKHAD